MKKIVKRPTLWDWIYWMLAAVPLLLSLIFYKHLPDQVPTSWGADNQVNGYSSRNMACFGIPLFMLAMAALINVFYRIDPKRENIRRSREMMQITRWFVVLLAILVQAIIVLAGTGREVDVGVIVSVSTAVLFIVIGNYLPRCRQNYTMGIKLPWTLADEENWNRTHRLAGYVWMAGGCLMLILGLLRMASMYFAVILIMVLIPSVYSYWIYRKKSDIL